MEDLTKLPIETRKALSSGWASCIEEEVMAKSLNLKVEDVKRWYEASDSEYAEFVYSQRCNFPS